MPLRAASVSTSCRSGTSSSSTRPTISSGARRHSIRFSPSCRMQVPTMYVTALYDQEDMYGGVHTYAALEPRDSANDHNFLVLGPWRHSGVNYDGTTLGPLKLEGNTALQFRREVMQPFLDAHLKDGAPPAATPPAFVYETGSNVWRRLQCVAAVVRIRLRLQAAAAVPAARICAGLRGAAQGGHGLRRVCVRSCQAGTEYAATGAFRRRAGMAALAARGSALRLRPSRRADLCECAAAGAAAHRRRAGW